MQSFLKHHAAEVKGTLSGLDRVLFRGTLRQIANVRGLFSYLSVASVLLKDFKVWAQGLTEQVRAATVRVAEAAGRPIRYLASSGVRKEERALEIAKTDGITEGLICVLTCVEPCLTFTVGPNRKLKRLELRPSQGKCLHQYFYFLHPQLGLLHVRVQTWLPFTIHVCVNGREWLARQLRTAGVGFEQRDNCLVDVADAVRAQQVFDEQLRTDWDGLLNGLLAPVHPAHRELFGGRDLAYYWSAEETEWATDVLFRSAESLAAVYPRLLRHAITNFSSADVLRFLGRQRFGTSQIHSTLKRRIEGTRVKHQLNRNSVKMYDKQGSVLRVETTINDPRDMKVYRTKEGEPEGRKEWLRLRKGVADLHRRVEVSQKSNERYLEALAAVEHTQPLGETVRELCQPTTWQGRRVRALQPLNPSDAQLLEAVNRGEFAVNGFRNRDLRCLLFGDTETTPPVAKQQTAKITRLIRLLRGHGLVQKVTKTHRYQLTDHGRTTITALLTARQASTQKLLQLAA